MSGWPAVIAIIAVELAAAVFLIRVAARRWWDYLVIAALAVAFAPPIETHLTGDISRYLPAPIWSDGSDGKDQIVDVSAASSLLLPLIAAAALTYLLKLAWTRLAAARQND
jgi:hypothetical protein